MPVLRGGEGPMIRIHDRELNGVFSVEPDTVGRLFYGEGKKE